MINLPGSLEYRYVLIPGAIPGGAPMQEKGINAEPNKIVQLKDGRIMNLTNMSYDETFRFLGINP